MRTMTKSATPDAADRLLGGLGLAARAGRLRIGVDAVRDAVRRDRAAAVVIAGDAPKYVRRKLEPMLDSRTIAYRVQLDGDRLGRAIGRERVVALAIVDPSLGRRVLELADAVEELAEEA